MVDIVLVTWGYYLNGLGFNDCFSSRFKTLSFQRCGFLPVLGMFPMNILSGAKPAKLTTPHFYFFISYIDITLDKQWSKFTSSKRKLTFSMLAHFPVIYGHVCCITKIRTFFVWPVGSSPWNGKVFQAKHIQNGKVLELWGHKSGKLKRPPSSFTYPPSWLVYLPPPQK